MPDYLMQRIVQIREDFRHENFAKADNWMEKKAAEQGDKVHNIIWYEQDDHKRKMWEFSGFGVGKAVFALLNPGVEIPRDTEGRWNIAHVYPEGETSETWYVTCQYEDGALIPERTTLLLSPVLQVGGQSWAAKERQCPKSVPAWRTPQAGSQPKVPS